MNTYHKYIKGEFQEFQDSHKNKFNLAIHILSGILYKSSLNCLIGNKAVLLYMIFLFFSYDKKAASFFSCISIQMASRIILYYEIRKRYLIVNFLLGCFILPEISHLLTKEKTVLNMNNATFSKVATNITFFLPFSIHQYLS